MHKLPLKWHLRFEGLTVYSDIPCSVKAVDPQNKKKEEKRRRWRNGHILQSVKNHETCAVHLNN